MIKYLLPQEGIFYKANLHSHSTFSDGKFSPERIKEEYIKNGYSIVAFTDHDILINRNYLTDDSFLALNGFEIEINENSNKCFDNTKTCHLCVISKSKNNDVMPIYHRNNYLFANAVNYRHLIKYDKSKPDYIRRYSIEGINEIISICKDNGFYVFYNHPNWSMEDMNLFTKLNELDAIEIYNSSCIVNGHNDINEKEYDQMIRSNKYISCLGNDDNHNFHPLSSPKSDSFKSFTYIKSKSLDYENVIDALINKHLYASMGPEIYELYVIDNEVYIKCSNVKKIRYNTGSRHVEIIYASEFDKDFINEAKFKIRKNDIYFRITIIDENNKQANTIAYKVDDYYEE